MARSKITEPSYNKPEDKTHETLVQFCIDLHDTYKKSDYRKKMLEEVQEARKIYEQKADKKNFPWKNSCFHKDVDILTESGWKLAKDVEVNEKVYSREPITGKITLENVTNTFTYKAPSNGLIRLKNLFFDIQVTDNHKFHLERPGHPDRKNIVRKTTACEILEGFKGQICYKLPLTGRWDTESAVSLWEYKPEDFLSFLGWYISEGWGLYKNRTIGLGQSIKANPENVFRITSLLDRMGLCYTYHEKEAYFLVNVDGQLAKHLHSLGNRYKKYIPKIYLDLPPAQLKFLFDALISGDGCISWPKDKHRNYPGVSYATTSPQLSDDFQELCMKLGYSTYVNIRYPKEGGKIRGRRITSKKPLYNISVRFTKYTRFRQDRATIERIPYSGLVYSLEVPPHHTVYVRQNGKTLWSGNSNLILPFETISIDNLEPRLLAGLVGREPVVQFTEDDAKKDEPTEMLEDWFDKELRNNVKIEEIARHVVHTLLLEGTRCSIVQYTSKDIVRRKYVFDEVTKELVMKDNQPEIEEFKDPAFEGCEDESVPLNKALFPDDVGTLKEWEEADRIREVDYTYSELLDKIDEEGNIEEGWANIGPWLLPAKTKKTLQEKDKTPSQIVAGVDVTGKETIPCIECHITYPMTALDEEKPKDMPDFSMDKAVVTIIPNAKLLIHKVLLRDLNMNNESIFKRVRLFPEEGRSYGSPIHTKLKGIQEGGSDIFNLVINIATVMMIPWYFTEVGAGVPGKVEIFPGVGIEVNDVSKIKFPEFRVNPNQFIEFINIFIQLWERSVSLSEPQIGKQATEKTTATEILAVIQEGNIKHNYQAKTFKEEFLSIIRTMFDLYYQYMPYDKMIEWNDNEVPFPRAAMRRPHNFRLTGSTEQSNKLIERKESEDFFGFAVGDPLFNQVQIREDLLKSYGRTNTDDYISPEINDLIQLYLEFPEEVQQLLAPLIQQLQAAQAQEGEGEQQAA